MRGFVREILTKQSREYRWREGLKIAIKIKRMGLCYEGNGEEDESEPNPNPPMTEPHGIIHQRYIAAHKRQLKISLSVFSFLASFFLHAQSKYRRPYHGVEHCGSKTARLLF